MDTCISRGPSSPNGRCKQPRSFCLELHSVGDGRQRSQDLKGLPGPKTSSYRDFCSFPIPTPSRQRTPGSHASPLLAASRRLSPTLDCSTWLPHLEALRTYGATTSSMESRAGLRVDAENRKRKRAAEGARPSRCLFTPGRVLCVPSPGVGSCVPRHRFGGPSLGGGHLQSVLTDRGTSGRGATFCS